MTHRERKVLILTGLLILAGSLLKFFNVNRDIKKLSSIEYLEKTYVSPIINVNTASNEELTGITGIGDVIAERIVEYRLKNGLFQNLNDIKNIKGIGTKKFEMIKDKITL